MGVKHEIAGSLARIALAAERRLRPRTVSLERCSHVLVLEYMLPLGACVHMTSVFEAIKRKSGTTLTVATRGIALGLLRHSPFIDHLIATPDPLTDLHAASKLLALELARRKLDPDCCVTGASDQRTRIAALGALACRGWRGGYTIMNVMYHKPLDYDQDRSLIANNLRLAGLIGAPEDHCEPRIFYSPQDAAIARSLLEPLRAAGKPVLVVVSQNSGGQRTGWRAEHWLETVRYAQDVLGYAIAYVGTAGDRNAIEALEL